MEKIIGKYLQGKASMDEQSALLDYLRDDPANLHSFRQQKQRWKEENNQETSFSAWNAWQKIKQSIRQSAKNRKIKRVIAFTSAASIVLAVLSASTYIFVNNADNVITVQAEQGQKKLVLPDSTLVYLNANSGISYNAALFPFNRTLNMTGEAFFDVRKKSLRKFKVNVNNVNVAVLGTRFNVKAYEARPSIDIVLEEGNIEITLDDAPEFSELLQPGEKAAINVENNHFSLTQVDPWKYSSWKKGILSFKNSRLPEFLDRLEEYYGTRFIMEDDERLRNLNISLTINNESLDDVLEVLQLVLPVAISSETSNYYVKPDPKRCPE